jgi:hypothetical protein
MLLCQLSVSGGFLVINAKIKTNDVMIAIIMIYKHFGHSKHPSLEEYQKPKRE